MNYEDEFSHKERYSQFDTIDKFKTFWQSSLVIESAIIPPENTNSNGGMATNLLFLGNIWNHIVQGIRGVHTVQ